jgi:tRNA/tmRNA/rRNA uracil-C5-methylase (TrmA/RlmC/RlmD family)
VSLPPGAFLQASSESEAVLAGLVKEGAGRAKRVADLFAGIGTFRVLDPPRAGAKAQAETLAESKVPKVVMVSCNPGTCARDLRILVDGGYRITRVVPVDQFLFSPHVELVAMLER